MNIDNSEWSYPIAEFGAIYSPGSILPLGWENRCNLEMREKRDKDA
jgi:hypothetical protein